MWIVFCKFEMLIFILSIGIRRRKMKRRVALGVLILLSLSLLSPFSLTTAQTSSAVTVIIGVTADTYIEAGKDKNYNGYSLYVGRMSSGGVGVAYRTLLYFDLSGLPSGCMISKATLCLEVERDLFTKNVKLLFMAITSPWDEDEVTWYRRTKTERWSSSGGDFERTPYAEIEVGPGLKRNDVISVDITELVRKWYRGEMDNYGIMVLIPPPSEVGDPGILELINEEYGASPLDNARLYVTCMPLGAIGAITSIANPLKPGIHINIPVSIGMGLALQDSTLEVTPGSFNKTLVTLVSLSGTCTVNLHATPLSSGISVSFNTTTLSAGETAEVTVTVDSSVSPGDYKVMIEGYNPSTGKTCTTELTVKVVTPGTTPTGGTPTFDIIPSSNRLEVTQGSYSTLSISLTSIRGYSYSVSLSVSGLPSGVTATFSPASGTPSFTSVLNLSASTSASPGKYTITVIATGADGTTKSFTLTLIVKRARGVCGSITASVSPSSLSINQGDHDTVTVSISSSNTGCRVRVKTVSPTGISASATPRECNTPCTSTIDVSVSSAASPGAYTLRIIVEDVSGGGVKDEETINVNVQAPSGGPPSGTGGPGGPGGGPSGTPGGAAVLDFDIKVSPDQAEIYQGDTVTAAVSVMVISGHPSQVDLRISGCPSGALCTLSKSKVIPPATVTLTIDSGSAKGVYTVVVVGESGGKTKSATLVLNIKEKKCFIATATYGSEVAGEVQFLREFRDNIVLSTKAGKAFYRVFDAFYYSWSPYVARVISSNAYLRTAVRLALYPLLAALKTAAYTATSLIQVNTELAVVVAGTIACLLIGMFYLAPFLLLIARKKIKVPEPRYMLALYVLTLLTVLMAEYASLHVLSVASTLYVIICVVLGSLFPLYLVKRVSLP